MGVAAVIATDSIHNLDHMAITQLHSYCGDTPTQQQRSFAGTVTHCTVMVKDQASVLTHSEMPNKVKLLMKS